MKNVVFNTNIVIDFSLLVPECSVNVSFYLTETDKVLLSSKWKHPDQEGWHSINEVFDMFGYDPNPFAVIKRKNTISVFVQS